MDKELLEAPLEIIDSLLHYNSLFFLFFIFYNSIILLCLLELLEFFCVLLEIIQALAMREKRASR